MMRGHRFKPVYTIYPQQQNCLMKGCFNEAVGVLDTIAALHDVVTAKSSLLMMRGHCATSIYTRWTGITLEIDQSESSLQL